MGSWTEHNTQTGGYYKCNRYDAAKPEPGESAASKAKAELERYLHYYKRYHGHDQALKFAVGQRETADRRMAEQQESQRSSWIDVQFLKQAAEQVIDCRRVLKYTYVLGYSLADDTAEKRLFEHHQEMLEKNTEKLHEYTEQPLSMLERSQVVNHTRVTERFMSSLLQTMVGGTVSTVEDLFVSSSSSSSSSSASSSSASSSSSDSAGPKQGGGGAAASANAAATSATSTSKKGSKKVK